MKKNLYKAIVIICLLLIGCKENQSDPPKVEPPKEPLEKIIIDENEFDGKLKNNKILNIDIVSLASDKLYNVNGIYIEDDQEGDYETLLSFDYIRESLLRCDSEKNENSYLKLVTIDDKILDELVKEKQENYILVDRGDFLYKSYIKNMMLFEVLEIDADFKREKTHEKVVLITISIVENFTQVDTNNKVKKMIEKEKEGEYLKLFVSIEHKNYFEVGKEYLYHYDYTCQEYVYHSDKRYSAYNLNELEFVLPLKEDRIDEEKLLESQTSNYKSIFSANLVLPNEEDKLKTNATLKEFDTWLTAVNDYYQPSSFNETIIYDIRTGERLERIVTPSS